MPASVWPSFRFLSALFACGLVAVVLAVATVSPVFAQEDRIRPVTDAELQDPSPDEWLMWRRTLNGWGYSPLDQVNRDNVAGLQMVWSRALTPGRQQGTPLVRDGVLFMPNPRDVIQAIDAVTGDLIWEYRRDRPDDLGDYMIGSLIDTNRNIAIHGELIIDTTMDDHIIALHAETGEVVWDTEILDYKVNPANQTSGPIVANGKAYSGRSCDPRGGPLGCVITAHDAATGEELWRRRLIPGPGEFGDETWGDVPFEQRGHVGSWMVPSVDPELNLVYVGTSVTSPAPKFMLGGVDKKHLYHNSTLALNADTGEIVWYYQHLNDHWDLDHPFERILVDTAVAPDPAAVDWINPRLQAGETRRVLTGIPGKTGVVYTLTLDRATGEFLWATPTVTQNVIGDIDGATGEVSENAEVVFHVAWTGGLRLSDLERRQGLGGGRLQSPDQRHVHAAAQHLCAHDGHAGLRRRHPRCAHREPLRGLRHRLPGTSWPRAPTTPAPRGPSPPRPVRRSGYTSNARRPCRSWRPAADSSSAATSTAASGPCTTRRPRSCGRSTSGRRSPVFRSPTPSTDGSTWRSAPAPAAPPRTSPP